ncbi:MAG TPA: OmpA family protein [Ferruginibacter sp.]|nr:OmpA family protein [Ferruginibacter sp.]
MKKILVLIVGLGLFTTSFGQDHKKRPSFGIHFLLNDFRTAQNLRTSGLSNVVRAKDWNKATYMTSGLAVSYLRGLNNNLDFMSTLSGTFVDYPIVGKPAQVNPGLLLEGIAAVNLKLLSDKYYVNPFLTAGIGASKYKGYYGAFMPFGLGVQVKIVNEVFLMWNSQYRVPVTENASYHFYHSIGVVAPLTKKKEIVVVPPPPPPPPPPADRDGDGVLDVDDKCPDVAGLASLQGCPDRDGDGIADAEDKCPDVAGLARYQGCPIPDTDKDGINDEVDKCPTVPGLARYQGCPIPDTDGDGVNDEEDKCINEKGPASNFGCPVINEEIIKKVNRAAQNIFFETAKSKLLAKSFPKLNEVVTILNENPSFKVQIDGHTDAQGKDEYNQGLSDERAASVKAYLVSKGIAEGRLSSTGYGETKPVADNKTAAGRAKNRRVEMTLSNY